MFLCGPLRSFAVFSHTEFYYIVVGGFNIFVYISFYVLYSKSFLFPLLAGSSMLSQSYFMLKCTKLRFNPEPMLGKISALPRHGILDDTGRTAKNRRQMGEKGRGWSKRKGTRKKTKTWTETRRNDEKSACPDPGAASETEQRCLG